MEFNAAPTFSTFARSNTILDGSKIPELPLAGPSSLPTSDINTLKNQGSTGMWEVLEDLAHDALHNTAKHHSSDFVEIDRFPSPEEGCKNKGAVEESADHSSSFSAVHTGHQYPPRVPMSVAPTPTPTSLPKICEEINRLYALESEQMTEIKALTTELLAAAYKVSLATLGGIASRYRQQIGDLLGKGVERRIVLYAEHLKTEGKLPVRMPEWDFGVLERRSGSEHDQALDKEAIDPSKDVVPASSMPPPPTIPCRKRPRKEDSYEEVLQVEESLSYSRRSSWNSTSSDGVPTSKRLRLDETTPRDEGDAILELIWGRYFATAEEDGSDGDYSSPEEETSDEDESDSEAEEDVTMDSLVNILPQSLKDFIEEAADFEAEQLAEEAAAKRPPSPSTANTAFPVFSQGSAAERPPIPPPCPNPPAPRRLQRSNVRLMIDEDGGLSAVDYTTTEEYRDRLRLERESRIMNEQCGFDNRLGPCDLSADLREIAQVALNGVPLLGMKWRFRFDEQAWKDFET